MVALLWPCGSARMSCLGESQGPSVGRSNDGICTKFVWRGWLPWPLADFDPVKRSDVLSKSRRRSGVRLNWPAAQPDNRQTHGSKSNGRPSTRICAGRCCRMPNATIFRRVYSTTRRFRNRWDGFCRSGRTNQEIALLWIDVLNLRKEFSLWGTRGNGCIGASYCRFTAQSVGPDAVLGRFSGRSFLVSLNAAKFNQHARRRDPVVVESITPIQFSGSK